MKRTLYRGLVMAGTLALISSVSTSALALNPHVKADNSAVNVRDQSVMEVTAQDQEMTATAAETTRLIRTQLTTDAALSTYAKNVKIIVVDDLITLKGPVKSEAERVKIARVATDVAPKYKIENQLQVVK